MKQRINILIITALLATPIVQAANTATLRFQNGAVRTLSDLTVQDGKIALPDDQISVAVSTIANIDVEFETLSVEQCESRFAAAEFNELAAQMDAALAPLKPFEAIPGNLDAFFHWQMRARFWAGQYDSVLRRAELLKTQESPFAAEAALYAVLAMIEEGQMADAATAFATLKNLEAALPTMTQFIRGRLAMAEKKYPEALQFFSNGVVFHSRDSEWMPASTFYEGMVYKRTGYLVAALNIAEELELAWPDTVWSRRAMELK